MIWNLTTNFISCLKKIWVVFSKNLRRLHILDNCSTHVFFTEKRKTSLFYLVWNKSKEIKNILTIVNDDDDWNVQKVDIYL